jgi:hypothetical protein
MKKILLSLAPVSVETLKSLIQRSPGVPEFDVIDGHEMSGEELAKAFAKADVVLGTLDLQAHREGFGGERVSLDYPEATAFSQAKQDRRLKPPL